MGRPLNRPQPQEWGDAMPAGTTEGMAPKVRKAKSKSMGFARPKSGNDWNSLRNSPKVRNGNVPHHTQSKRANIEQNTKCLRTECETQKQESSRPIDGPVPVGTEAWPWRQLGSNWQYSRQAVSSEHKREKAQATEIICCWGDSNVLSNIFERILIADKNQFAKLQKRAPNHFTAKISWLHSLVWLGKWWCVIYFVQSYGLD